MPEFARGTCHVLFAYDIAFSIDLNKAESQIKEVKQRGAIKHQRRGPKYFQYQPLPLRVTQGVASLGIADFHTRPAVDVVLYDFGGATVVYSIPFGGPLEDLRKLSDILYENLLLLNDSRKRVEDALAAIQGAVSKPNVSAFVEDYVVFQIEDLQPPLTIVDLVVQHRQILAQILRAETHLLSEDEIADAVSRRVSFGRDDVTIVDWNSAIVIDQEYEDTLAVLEFANLELMEMRHLDHRIDNDLGLAYETLSKRPWRRLGFGSNPGQLQRVAQWQVDSAVLFEGVNNSLKLVGDQYLARLYRTAADRFHLAEWDAAILRKLETLDGIYSKISDIVTARRMELLEWIIIILFVISIVLPFFITIGTH
jgi:hypothetical protein